MHDRPSFRAFYGVLRVSARRVRNQQVLGSSPSAGSNPLKRLQRTFATRISNAFATSFAKTVARLAHSVSPVSTLRSLGAGRREPRRASLAGAAKILIARSRYTRRRRSMTNANVPEPDWIEWLLLIGFLVCTMLAAFTPVWRVWH